MRLERETERGGLLRRCFFLLFIPDPFHCRFHARPDSGEILVNATVYRLTPDERLYASGSGPPERASKTGNCSA